MKSLTLLIFTIISVHAFGQEIKRDTNHHSAYLIKNNTTLDTLVYDEHSFISIIKDTLIITTVSKYNFNTVKDTLTFLKYAATSDGFTLINKCSLYIFNKDQCLKGNYGLKITRIEQDKEQNLEVAVESPYFSKVFVLSMNKCDTHGTLLYLKKNIERMHYKSGMSSECVEVLLSF